MKCKCGCDKDIGEVSKYYPNKEFCKGHRLPYKTKIVKCDNCGKEIRKSFAKCWSHLKHHFCSRKCTGKYKNRNTLYSICFICKKPLVRCPSHIRSKSNRFYCSTKCQGVYNSKFIKGKNHPNWKPKIKKICKLCNKDFEVPPYEKYRIFCSHRCFSKWIIGKFVGKKSPHWKGGITPKTNLRCSSVKWIRLRKKIYKRDNWTCQICGKKCHKKGEIQCHHIIPYNISKNHNSKNLITLCVQCHSRIEPKSKVNTANFHT